MEISNLCSSKKVNNTVQQILILIPKLTNTHVVYVPVALTKSTFTENSMQRMLFPKEAILIAFITLKQKLSNDKLIANNTKQHISQIFKYVQKSTKQQKITQKLIVFNKNILKQCTKHRTKKHLHNTKLKTFLQNVEYLEKLSYTSGKSNAQPYRVK